MAANALVFLAPPCWLAPGSDTPIPSPVLKAAWPLSALVGMPGGMVASFAGPPPAGIAGIAVGRPILPSAIGVSIDVKAFCAFEDNRFVVLGDPARARGRRHQYEGSSCHLATFPASTTTIHTSANPPPM